MILRKQHIILTMLLLLLGSGMNEAWAKVTYHILSLPMSTKQLDGTDHQAGTLIDFRTNVRVEVLRVVSSDLHVNLPFEYRSPLATNYRYYAASAIAQTGPFQLYGYNNTTYYFYNIKDNTGTNTTNNDDYGDGDAGDDNTPTTAAVDAGVRLSPGATCADNIHIYVTYDVKASPDIDLSTTLDTSTGLLSASKTYNIHLKDRMVVLNQNRQNRPGAVLDGYYTSEQLASDDFSWIEAGGLNNTAGWRHFTFKFGGNDPYNVTIYTAYDKNTTFRGTGQADFFTKDVKEKDKYSKTDVYKEYRGSSFFRLMSDEMNDKNMWLSSDADIQWQEGGSRDNAIRKVVPGYYKGPNDTKTTLYEMSPIFNSFAILNHKSGTGYAFAGSKMNNGTNNRQPRAKDGYIQFMDYRDDGNNITVVYKAEASACKVDVYEVKEYVFRVVTPFGSNVDAIADWSDYAKGETITADMIPDELKRKYVNFTGSFYTDAAHNTAVTTFEAAQTNCSKDGSGRPIIYVGYEVVGAPFTAITAANKTTGYATATWYELTDKDSSGKKIKWDATNSVYKNNGGASEYAKESEFAFIGDPYELRIINRALTATNSRNFYVGSTLRTTDSDLTNFDSNSGDETAGFKWEIPYDETLGSFTLREFGSTDAYWQWNTSEGNNIQYSTSASTRIKISEIGKVNYTFKVVDLAGNIAIQASAELTPFTTLTGTGVGYSIIPSTIRCPYIADETITFWSTYSGSGRSNLSGQLTELPGTACDIFVKYTTERLGSKSITLREGQSFNVKLNDEYIYWDSSTGKILSNADPGINPETGNSYLEDNQYLWRLRGRDPYAMIIDNIGATVSVHSSFTDNETVTIYDDNGTSSSVSRYKGDWVKILDVVNEDGSKNLTFDQHRANASRFIPMLGNYAGVYEVMVATGTNTYYHIGRASTEGAETKIYSTSTYAHGADQLRFVLEGTNLIQYHLIDKSGKEIFRNEISSKNARLSLPQEYVSPLVATYHYYASGDVVRSNGADGIANTEDDIFTPVASPTDLSEAGSNTEIYVFYDVSDFGFGTSYPRLLKFLDPAIPKYYLEDGADKLTDTKIQPVYPYCNGDGNLNIYGQPMNEEQMNGGSSTRPRWVWFFESANSDPYHVKIHSKSTISFGGGTHTTYLQTQAIHFNQDANANLKHIVTGANFPGISLQAATEYMILGTTGRYKLVTTAKIAADEDGNGTIDEGENVRRTVNSFEQYWKTYNMIKQHLLGYSKSDDENTTDESKFTVPQDLRARLATELDEEGIGSSNWHSYDAIANAVRWNGYSADGKQNTKVVEKLEHWFQTFDMGDGTFDIEDANIPPVLVLLDRHGWEIMRLPLPTSSTDPERDHKLAALRAFDSPMVKEYKFYNNATKAAGCHKYVLRLNSDGTDRDPITVNDVQFTSNSLADLPPLTAKGVISNGTINDQFVTYTVKEEYEKSYNYSLVYEEIKTNNKVTGYKITSETGTPSTFIVLQNNKYAQANGTAIDGKSVQSGGLSDMIINPDATADSNNNDEIDDVNLWYVQPNLDIDDEMGIPWSGTIGNSNEPYMKNESKVKYKDKTGFDPYNLQLKNVQTGKFFTTHMTQSVLSGGVYTGVYSGTGGSTNVTLADACSSPVPSPESYDHTTLQMTNQTFMAVQDENGNMQLMPRFDHSTRINAFSTLAPAETAPFHEGAQTTEIVRPLVFDYHIIDNNGNTALRYKAAGEYYPAIPAHFQSPLAKDFTFYFGHAAYTTATSTMEAFDAAASAQQMTATNEADMNAQAKALTALGDYFFKVGSDPYTYIKVTVTNVADGFTSDVTSKKDISNREITGSFAAAGIQNSANIYIRYSYDKDYDSDHDNILQGRWMTMKLNEKDVQADGTVTAGEGTGVSLYTGTKDAAYHVWQWKFLASPSVPTLPNGDANPYYTEPDPYAVKIFNRSANSDSNPTANPNKMGTPIKISGKDRFVLLAHPNGDYALAAAGDGLTYSFLNGNNMTAPDASTPVAASVEDDASFSTSPSYSIADAEQVQFINDVTNTFTYKVITNDHILAASTTQDESTARSHDFEPYLPEAIQTPLLNQSDYLYYGTSSESSGVYTIDTNSELQTLYGLYDDIVYVRYQPYNELNSPYKVPNVKGTADGHVARGSESNDASLGLNANLLYNIIWYNDEMMRCYKSDLDGGSADDAIRSKSGEALTSTPEFEWQLEGNDPYAIQIKSVGASSGETNKYIHEVTSTTTTELSTTPTTFMILNRDGYDYGVLVKTGTPVVGGSASMLSGHGEQLVTTAPNHFIIFALATYKVIYHLMIANTGTAITIPYKGPETNDVLNNSYPITTGTTQRDLTSGDPTGSTYQLGTNLCSILPSSRIGDRLYCVDAGCISLGDVLKVPDELYRPNVVYKFYVEGVYNSEGTAAVDDMNGKYKGCERTTMGDDAGLLGKTVLINVVYSFNEELGTNAGEGFVTAVSQNKWYTFEARGATPRLAEYTGTLQTKSGYATHYTNDYLWTPLGDPYGFVMYNRYMYKNLGQASTVMTTSEFKEGTAIKMSSSNAANSVYELLADESTTAGYFKVHPVVNNEGTQYYMRDNSGTMELSTTATEWTFGLSEDVMRPYYEGAGNVGGLNAAGAKAYKDADDISDTFERLVYLQKVVYNHDNDGSDPNNPNYIVHYAPGYYRLHNQPGSVDISTPRYASGYLHAIERDPDGNGNESDAIPMHFYSRTGVNTTFEGDGGLGSGFTETAATRGAIPVPATEYDPSSIFYFTGSSGAINISTQGLNVVGNKMTTGTGTSFDIIDIGGGVVAFHNDNGTPANATDDNYLTYKQTDNIYDLKYSTVGDESARWCMEPASNQGLMVTTHSGGDGFFYTTFCAPFDIELPKDDGSTTYNAFICPTWDGEVIHPTKVPAVSGKYAEGKFVPAATPVILRTTDNSGKMKLTLPSNSPTTALTSALSGKYLEQLLPTEIILTDMVYSFGLPITGYGLITATGDTNGDITDVLNKNQADTGVGFYLNANPNKEKSEETGLWVPNNRYVYHNKIYYRGTPSVDARQQTRGVDFIPVVFDFDEDDDAFSESGQAQQGRYDNRVYDLQGRCVATEQQVSDGTWRQRVAPGIYIINGRKVRR